MENRPPLHGIRVLDLSRILAGPWASQALADLGAQVIKIEHPKKGDDTRHWGPPFVPIDEERLSAYFICANRNKQSLSVDISTEQGQAIVKELAKHCDVVIENFKTGGLKRYGLDYESLSTINPKLVMCSITGFGQTGPYAEMAGYDFLLQGMGGLMSVTGEADNKPGGGPQKVGVAVTDIFTGLYACIALQAALIERQQSGLGQHIDLALFDVQAAILANQASNYLNGDQLPQRLGNAHPNIVPYQAFATKDSHIILAIGNDSQFAKFAALTHDELLMHDARFATNEARVDNRLFVCEHIAELLCLRDSEYWLTELTKLKVPCGPINTIDQVFADPQIQHRQMVTTFDDSPVKLVKNPINFSRSPLKTPSQPPKLGQDKEQVLSEVLGYSQAQIEALKKAGII